MYIIVNHFKKKFKKMSCVTVKTCHKIAINRTINVSLNKLIARLIAINFFNISAALVITIFW